MEKTKKKRRAATWLAAVLLLVAVAQVRAVEPPKNIILMIGDGMAASHITAARVHAGELNMERLPSGGLQWTFAANTLVTDSAASGTAIATGHKTYNGAISVTEDRRPVTTVLEHAEARGMATGLVATCSITHATPAVFAAHVDDRSMDNAIALQMAEAGVEVLFGGGWAYFTPSTTPGGAREDGRDLIAEMERWTTVVRSAEDFRALGDVESAVGLFARAHPGVASVRDPSLVELTAKALEILSSDPDGFFLMVEGSQIDWAGHENDAAYMIDEMMDFDAAVGAAVDFAEGDGRTLVIVTADHECGGLTVLDGSLEERTFTAHHACGDHTATAVPILSLGPGSEIFSGIVDNTDIGRGLIEMVASRPNGDR
ncbi:MAG: alkaline phosphatase [Candidatus Eisenbacteria bacterium]|nr:alkaline phosphatase [Candidatus Eisenbacteria bacterium]